MRCIWKQLSAMTGGLLIASYSFAALPSSPAAAPQAASANESPADEQQLRPLLDKLGELSQLIERNAESPQVWQYHLEQAEVLLRLASQSRPKERESILRMAVDGFASAALLCPREQPVAVQRLQQLPQRLAHFFPGSPSILYAVLQEIQTDCTLMLEKTGGDRVKTEEYHCKRLLQFAQEHPEVPEAARAVLQAAHIGESLGETDEACRCYRYLIEHFPDDAASRKAGGALWRLGQNHQPLYLKLPLLYSSSGSGNATFNLDELRGRLVVVYFWASTSDRAVEDFQTLKQLTDRFAGRGLEVVYVNMDAEAARGRAFLSGRLTAGIHVYQPGGLDGPVAEGYGIQEVPQTFLVDRDGTLLKHSLSKDRLEAELTDRLPRLR
jgi:peroxiredoxin